jgi:hypothetical protein
MRPIRAHRTLQRERRSEFDRRQEIPPASVCSSNKMRYRIRAFARREEMTGGPSYGIPRANRCNWFQMDNLHLKSGRHEANCNRESKGNPCSANRIPCPITMIEDVRAFGRFPPDYPFEQFSSPSGEVRDIARTSKFSQAFES